MIESRPTTRFAVWLVLFIGANLVACRATTGDEYLARGDRYASAQQYSEAITEYRRAVTAAPTSGKARVKLADAYMQRSNLAAAAKEYKNAAELLPDDAGAQLKWLGMLQLGRMYTDVREGTETLLRKDPKNAAARVLHARANAGLKRFDLASSELQQAIVNDPANSDDYYVNLGAVQLLANKPEGADASFAASARAAPNSVTAHLMVAGNNWAHGRLAAAEQSFKRVLELDPDNRTAQRALAAFYLRGTRVADAEQYLKAVAVATPTTPVRLLLADYYLMNKRPADAAKILATVAQSSDGYAEARSRLAVIDDDAGRKVEARKFIDETLRNDATKARPLLTKAQFLLADHHTDEALPLVKTALAIDPRSVAGHAMLASIHASQRDMAGAISELSEVVKLEPRSSAAQLELARLHLASGTPALAIDLATQVVKTRPRDFQARLLLIRAFIGKGDLARAETEIRTLLAEQPGLAEAHTLAGTMSLMKNDRRAARAAYERSLGLPDAGLEPLKGLLGEELVAGRAARAVALIEQRLARQPDDPVLWQLAGRMYLNTGAVDNAEAAFRKAIEFDASNPEAYGLLAQVYLSRHQQGRAQAQFEAMLERDPKSVAALTLLGMVLEMESQPAEAAKRYEKALEIDPHAVVAANNLAWLYAARGSNLDVALQLAQAAARDAPEQPVVSDTLGWVYYKKNLTWLAIRPLEFSVAKTPGNPVFRYHLGLAYARLGDTGRARKALEDAIGLNPDFDGAADARTVLASLNR